MAIKTPDILPGERGYISKKERTQKRKAAEKKAKRSAQRKDKHIGKIRVGRKGYRIGRPTITPRKEKKYPIWRFSKKIGEIVVNTKDLTEEGITLTFNRLGGIGNYKHLIQDADFQMHWAIREQELLLTQKNCYLCKRKLSKTAQPNLYHYNLFKKRAALLEKAEKVPRAVVNGTLSIQEGWEEFNKIIEQGNAYYMLLKETALICATCVKQRGVTY